LRKIAIGGGPPMTLCHIAGAPRGGTWSDTNEIVFATNNPATGLMLVASSGGEPKPVTKPESTADHVFPAALPGGRAIVYTVMAPGLADSAQLAVVNLATREQRTLLAGGSHPEYVSTGHLVYGYAGTLRAIRFDPDRLEVIGDAAPVEHGVLTVGATGAANFAISRPGHLVFVPGSGAEGSTRTLVWVDRAGRQEPIPAPPRVYNYVRISPDGSRLAFSARDQEQDIWVWDLGRKTSSRVTFGGAAETNPVWMPDGRRLLFASSRNGAPNLYAHSADGTGTTERLTTSPNLQAAVSVSRDGATLLMVEVAPATGADVHALRLDGKSKPQAILQTPHADSNPDLSPDGRWLSYTSTESGQPNVYVKPFPDVNAGRWHISPTGGSRSVWSHDGRELFYLALNGALMVVPVETGNTFRAGNPVKLFDSRYFAGVPGRPYDVAADGRFVMIKEPNVDESANRGSLVFVSNWTEELKTKLPPK
jgi:dipeptidyl aminopeptidase/acylaminoacyl peptidase